MATQLGFHNPIGEPERILSIGAPGSGKSHDWLTIAQKCHVSGSDAIFYCLDSDVAIGRMIATAFPGLKVQDGGNVDHRRIYKWEDYTKNTREIIGKMREQDWLVVDMVNHAWEMVQGYFTEQVFGEDMGDLLLNYRKKTQSNIEHNVKDKGGKIKEERLDGWRDWSTINALYGQWIKMIVFRSPGNLFAVAPVEAISSDNDSPETRKLFGNFGVKPKGQKDLGHQFHTVLLKSANRPGEWKIGTIKDRGRVAIEPGSALRSFVVQYLMKVAGWKIG